MKRNNLYIGIYFIIWLVLVLFAYNYFNSKGYFQSFNPNDVANGSYNTFVCPPTVQHDIYKCQIVKNSIPPGYYIWKWQTKYGGWVFIGCIIYFIFFIIKYKDWLKLNLGLLK